jgi:hypothetical protein
MWLESLNVMKQKMPGIISLYLISQFIFFIFKVLSFDNTIVKFTPYIFMESL